MGGLHRGNDGIAGKEFKVGGVDHLGMFDAPAAVVLTPEETAIGMEHQPVGTVADGMGGHLVVVFQGLAAYIVIVLLGGDLKAPVSGVVGIGFQHQGAP